MIMIMMMMMMMMMMNIMTSNDHMSHLTHSAFGMLREGGRTLSTYPLERPFWNYLIIIL